VTAAMVIFFNLLLGAQNIIPAKGDIKDSFGMLQKLVRQKFTDISEDHISLSVASYSKQDCYKSNVQAGLT
jgi:hypothetical protein